MSFTVKVKEEVIGNKLSEPAKVSVHLIYYL